MPEQQLLMVKVFKALSADYQDGRGGRQQFKPLVRVTKAFRQMLASQVADIEEYFSASFARWPAMPCIAKVALHDKAYAKSKRPTGLFSQLTCPIVGGNKLGELYISVTPKGLQRLAHSFRRDPSDSAKSQISTVKAMFAFDRDDALGGESLASVKRSAQNEPLKLELFDHAQDQKNSHVLSALNDLVDRNQVQPLIYPSGMSVYELNAPPAVAARIASFGGTRLLTQFPRYHIVRTASRMRGALPARRFLPPIYQQFYPIVGQIDTGTDPGNDRLQMWVHDRFDFVPQELQDNSHGSFVAGLICNARSLNDSDDGFPTCQSKIVDVVAFDRTGEINEKDLMYIIRDAVARFPAVRVWNLSFSVVERVVSDHHFSPLAMLLEDLRRAHGVSFVIAAGNTDPDEVPPQPWPRPAAYGGKDRVCSPADAPTGLVVGGVAHLDSDSSCVRVGEPSPWTKRGPGVAYLPSPHVSHFSGNCTPDNDYFRLGLCSLDALGNLVEDVGTSFAAPLVSTLLANVASEVAAEDAPHILSQAVLMHSAFLRSAPGDIGRFNFVGVGTPPDIDEILHCRQSSATMIFQVDFGNKPVAMKHGFPIPPSMTDGQRMKGEILMTLAYDPPVLARKGFEYCLTNVNATLGTISQDGKLQARVPTYPTFNEDERTFERELLKYGFKWSPVKFYYRSFARSNTLASELWKLRMSISCRQGVRRGESHIAYLVITLRSGEDEGDVGGGSGAGPTIYDEMVRAMQLKGWAANDLKIRSRERTDN